jgi:LmbE family N-acetylglucosaminyl deacetylase
MPEHIYLSPHLDDAVFSCGGLIFQQTNRGEEVLILTICSGDPPKEGLSEYAQELHERWMEGESPVASRRGEDQRACLVLGAGYKHMDIQDGIYRVNEGGNHLYPSMAATFGEVDSDEIKLIDAIAAQIEDLTQNKSNLYVPMCYGGHVDHRLTRFAAESTLLPLNYYRDLPYAGRGLPLPEDLETPSGSEVVQPLSQDDVSGWVEAILAYKSQISTFWDDANSVVSEVHEVLEEWGGVPIRRSQT